MQLFQKPFLIQNHALNCQFVNGHRTGKGSGLFNATILDEVEGDKTNQQFIDKEQERQESGPGAPCTNKISVIVFEPTAFLVAVSAGQQEKATQPSFCSLLAVTFNAYVLRNFLNSLSYFKEVCRKFDDSDIVTDRLRNAVQEG